MDINLRVWDVNTHELLHDKRNHSDTINAVSWSTNGKYLVSGSFDSHAKVYDVDKEFEEILTVEPNGWRTVYGVAFSSDCKCVIITADVNIRVFSLSSGEEVGIMSGHTKQVRCLAMTTDGTYLVSGAHDRTIKVWTMSNMMEYRNMAGHNNFVLKVKVTPNNKNVISSSSDNTMRMWDIEEGKQIAIL